LKSRDFDDKLNLPVADGQHFKNAFDLAETNNVGRFAVGTLEGSSKNTMLVNAFSLVMR
jgi:hypothetical protein